MARTNSKTQLEALRQQQLDLVKKIKEAEAKTKKEQQEKDDRRKLLAGAVALKELDSKPVRRVRRCPARHAEASSDAGGGSGAVRPPCPAEGTKASAGTGGEAVPYGGG